MNPMKICFFTSLLTFCVFSLVVLSCNKKEPSCTGVFCNSGTCVDGSCQCPDDRGGKNCELEKCGSELCDYGKVCVNGGCACPDGFEGAGCAMRSRDKFVGSWVVAEDGTVSSPTQYSTNITSDANVKMVRILNFRVSLGTVSATINGDSIFIATQTTSNSVVIGKGIFTEGGAGGQDKIMLWYKVTNSSSVTDDFGYDAGAPSVWTK